LSIKTGGCPEDCAYCPQSAHYKTGVEREGLLSVEATLAAAQNAKAQGATRFCMGAAWRDIPPGEPFERVLEMVRGVRALDLEACCTLGMLTGEQAAALAEAGLTAYNHNLDTSSEFYGEIISTRTYQDRLTTLERVRRSGVTVCCGGIIGMGESRQERYRLLRELSTLDPHPESVPVNMLVRVEGTPLANQQSEDPLELVRMIATARILMPASMVRLSAGRLSLSDEAQALCFLAGANSIFMGDKLLTTPNPEVNEDQRLFDKLGMRLMMAAGGEQVHG
jgi:biotin synthase